MNKYELKLNKDGETGTLIINLEKSKQKQECYLELAENGVKMWFIYAHLVGPNLFTFTKRKVFNAWTDYPNLMSERQVEMFDKATNNYWHKFFKDRFKKKK